MSKASDFFGTISCFVFAWSTALHKDTLWSREKCAPFGTFNYIICTPINKIRSALMLTIWDCSRTFKDIITFIPFVIILLIPLSPIGHVLVFGAIQRFFPDFFPSCFTEQRQNLLQLYETAEYSEMTINETWQEKASRFTEAILYLTANALRTLFFKVRAAIQGESKSNDESSGSMEGEASKKGR